MCKMYLLVSEARTDIHESNASIYVVFARINIKQHDGKSMPKERNEFFQGEQIPTAINRYIYCILGKKRTIENDTLLPCEIGIRHGTYSFVLRITSGMASIGLIHENNTLTLEKND